MDPLSSKRAMSSNFIIGVAAAVILIALSSCRTAEDGNPCTPSCAPGTCGGDGCGGTCACASGALCLANQTCCTPSCAPGTCGSDGCGGTCTCASGALCLANQTCCTPSCAPGTCGSDGCGGTCSCGSGT